MPDGQQARTDEDPSLSVESYERLRALAASLLRRERIGHTLQATALAHEALLRVLKQPELSWKDENHMFAFAARAMRRILVNYALARQRIKRGGPEIRRSPLDEVVEFYQKRGVDLGAVDEAVEDLSKADQRQARIVELRFFAGLTMEEIAETMALSLATVKREWILAKLWLKLRLAGDPK